MPPKYALKFLRWFCREDYLEEIEGDLTEVFERQYETSPKKAKWKFSWSVIRYFRPDFIKSFKSSYHPNLFAMLRHNLLLTFRTYKRYKSSFFINLVGLSSGLACTLLIYLWVNDELSIDKFHENDQQLYRLVSNSISSKTLLNTSKVFAELLVEEMPEIEEAVFSSWGTIDSYLSSEDDFFNVKGEFGTEAFFDFFSYELIEGNKQHVLNNTKSIVLSESLALKLFQTTENIVGKRLAWQWFSYEEDVFVTGVFKDLPANSSMQFDYVLSFDVFEEHFRERIERGNQNVKTYFKINKNADIEHLNDKLYAYVKANYENASIFPFVIPYSSYYLYGSFENREQVGGRITYVQLFSIVALFILLMACINFMNLSTAKASRRLKEIGVKKAIGANRKMLIFQYFTESITTAFLALTVAFLLVVIALPFFNQLTGKQLVFGFNLQIIFSAFGITMLAGLIAGSYPALFLSSFSPLAVLKGIKQSYFGDAWIRKGLVIFQFTLSVILITGVIIVYKQIELIQNKNLGYESDHIISFKPQGWVSANQETFITEAKKITSVTNASSIFHALFGGQASTADIQWEGKDPDETIWFEHGRVNYGMLEMLDMELLEGRYFSRNFKTDTAKIILNETAVNIMGLQDPIGKTVEISGSKWEIIGVTKDFHFESLHEKIKPTFLRLSRNWARSIVLKIAAGKEREAIAQIEQLHKKLNPGFPFEYKFFDQDYEVLYQAEERVATLSQYFAVLAILISCLGLFGMVAFTTERRIKEIGIRKILGSSEIGIVYLLSGSFTKMVLIAILVALPLSYFIAAKWLESFAYRIDLTWWYFVIAGILALLIAWITVGLQTVKAAYINPVKCLKDE
ncbi:MAG: ABC transporter permease [Bacteroidota bacterium]